MITLAHSRPEVIVVLVGTPSIVRLPRVTASHSCATSWMITSTANIASAAASGGTRTIGNAITAANNAASRPTTIAATRVGSSTLASQFGRSGRRNAFWISGIVTSAVA